MKDRIKGWLPFSLFSLFLLSGCVTGQVLSDVQKGRMALLYGDPKVALSHFERAAASDPDYILNYSLLNEGVWTYVGRAHYAAGRPQDARQALEKARSRYQDDELAKLYLGLVLAQDGDRARGLKEIEAGLAGLHDWLDRVNDRADNGRFWDPSRRLRSAIDKNLAMLSGRDTDIRQLAPRIEWLGNEVEAEVEKVRRDRQHEQQMNLDEGGSRR